MPGWRRFEDWPVRAGIAAILVVASSLPLIIAAVVDIRGAKSQLLAATADVLAARGDQLVRELDAFNRSYQRAADEVAHAPDVIEFLVNGGRAVRTDVPAIRARLAVLPARDPTIRAVAILDTAGVVRIATDRRLPGQDLSRRTFVAPALQGAAVISDIYVAEPEFGTGATIAYLSPVRDRDDDQRGVAVLWIRADGLWNIARDANSLAGAGSYAVLFDRFGIRVAHTYSDDIVFHPGGRLDPSTLDAFVAEGRFGESTRRLLEDVLPFPEQFDRSRAATPETTVFKGFAPVNQAWNYGVARRMQSVPWTLFYMTPTSNLDAEVAEMRRQRVLFAAAIVALALAAGFFVALAFLRPLQALSKASNAIAGGDLGARVPAGRGNEIGHLASSFNAMAERIEAQAAALRQSRDALEARVDERTAALGMSEERTRLIIDTALDAVVTIDAAGLVTGWNAQAEAIFGWTAADVIGRALSDLIIPERYRDAHRQGMLRYHATGEGAVLNRRIELEAIHQRGHEFPIELAITAHPQPHGRVLQRVRPRHHRSEARGGSASRQRGALPHARRIATAAGVDLPPGWLLRLPEPPVGGVHGPASRRAAWFGWADHLHPDDRGRCRRNGRPPSRAATCSTSSFVSGAPTASTGGSRHAPCRCATAHGRIVKWFGSNTDFDYYKQSEGGCTRSSSVCTCSIKRHAPLASVTTWAASSRSCSPTSRTTSRSTSAAYVSAMRTTDALIVRQWAREAGHWRRASAWRSRPASRSTRWPVASTRRRARPRARSVASSRRRSQRAGSERAGFGGAGAAGGRKPGRSACSGGPSRGPGVQRAATASSCGS